MEKFNKLSYDEKLKEYIEMINDGYYPIFNDSKTLFSDGTIIGSFWETNIDKINEKLKKAEYSVGYDLAKRLVNKKIKKLSFICKIEEYIEKINNGYIPKSTDEEATFSDGSIIERFWQNNKYELKKELEKEKYSVGYELAKEVVNKIFQKLKEYIEKINTGYIPKYRDKKTKFLDGTTIDQFWSQHKYEIKEELEKDEYNVGYDLARKIVLLKNPKIDIKIEEYIDLLNKGYIPKYNDKKTTFSDGTIIGEFWQKHEYEIKNELEKEEYLVGYDLARKIVLLKNPKTGTKIEEYIEKINNGYIPKSNDKETTFLDGSIIGLFWTKNKDKIKEELEKEKYAVGYELAKEVVNNAFKKLSYEERIKEYIDLLNNGYIPKSKDKKTTFSDGSIIGEFWPNHKEKIKEELEKDKYAIGYDLAKEVVNNALKKLSYEERIKEYIDLLSNGYIPKNNDEEATFSDGTVIGKFWQNKYEIKKELEKEKHAIGYDLAKEVVSLKDSKNSLKIEEYIEKVNNGYIPKSNDKKTTFLDGTIIGQFWPNHKEKIKEELQKEKYAIGYDLAKELITKKNKKEKLEKEKHTIDYKDAKNIEEQHNSVDEQINVNNAINVDKKIIDILSYLNLDSKSIINNITNNNMSLNVAIGVYLLKNNQLREIYIHLIENLDVNLNQDKLYDIFIEVINKYKLTVKEITELKEAYISYIKIVKEYYLIDLALTDDFSLKVEKIEKYDLPVDYLEESYYYLMYVLPENEVIKQNINLYNKILLIRKYITQIEEFNIERYEEITKEEVEMVYKIKCDIEACLKFIKSK